MDWYVRVIYCQNKYLFTLAMRQFECDQLESIGHCMRREGWVTKVAVSIDPKVRVSIGLSEAALKRLLGLSLHTLKELKMKAKKSANLDSLRKLIFLFFFTVPFNSIAELSDYLIHFRTPGFLWYCVKADSNNLDDSEYDEELC